MAEQGRDDGSIAPRRGLGGPVIPPPPAGMEEQARKAEVQKAAAKNAAAAKRDAAEEKRTAREADQARKADEKAAKVARRNQTRQSAKEDTKSIPKQGPSAGESAKKPAPRRTRRAQLRLVQVDAWSVMKTAFLLSIALGIVLVVAVAIIWGVLGAAGVWESINSIVQQAVGNASGAPFDIREYAGTSRVLGFTMIVAVIDVVLITAIATLGAFLYNLSAALLGGIEVTLAEDS